MPLVVFDHGKEVVDGFDLRAIKKALHKVGIRPRPGSAGKK